MSERIPIAEFRERAERKGANGYEGLHRSELLAFVEAVEAAREGHQHQPGSRRCPLCNALARFDFEERP